MRSPDAAVADAGAPSVPPWCAHAALLLEVGRHAIEHGLGTGRPLAIDLARVPAAVCTPAASFVTLRGRRDGALRGCIGELEAVGPLVESVARNAFRAAFHDPRFAPVRSHELEELVLHLSVLGPLEPVAARDRAELVAGLRPGSDGLLIEAGAHRATFLPAVWSSLPDPDRFLAELERKAALPPGGWPPGLRAWRYGVHEVEEPPLVDDDLAARSARS